MKRTLVLVALAMLLGISVLAVACGDDETTETTTAASTETTAAMTRSSDPPEVCRAGMAGLLRPGRRG